MPKFNNLTGRRFGRLLVTSLSSIRKNEKLYYHCTCDCGKKNIKRGADLVKGSIKSCGCFQKESSQTRFLTHGFTKSGDKTKSRFYRRYHGINRRCSDPKEPGFKNYGGRGIKNLWSTFSDFKSDMWESFLSHINECGEENTFIDRINNNGDYSKENCRWVTKAENNNNTRANHLISFNGKTQNIAQWGKELNIKAPLIRDRLKLGWSIDDAFSKKKRNQKQSKIINLI